MLRLSESVRRMPSTERAGLICLRTRPMVFRSPVMADAGRYSVDTGMSTLSDATNAFTGIIPKVGAQSKITKS